LDTENSIHVYVKKTKNHVNVMSIESKRKNQREKIKEKKSKRKKAHPKIPQL